MKAFTSLLILLFSAQSVLGFVVPTGRVGGTATQPLLADPSTQSSIETDHVVVSTSIHRFSSSSLAGIITGATAFVGQSIAATDEYEMAELPPIWVPAVFGVVLLIGVALLTSSLGNVMDEEASLGMLSGSRAKKEIERSKSSYFGKRPNQK